MVVHCCVLNCTNDGIHRVKSFLQKGIFPFDIKTHQKAVQRVCPAHFSSLVHSTPSQNNDECVYEDVEYLDPDFDNYISNEDTDQCSDPELYLEPENYDKHHSMERLRKVFLFLVLCFQVVAKVLSLTVTKLKVTQSEMCRLKLYVKNMTDMKKSFTNLLKKNFSLKSQLKIQYIKLGKCESEKKQLTSNISKLFHRDQVTILLKNLKRPKKWSSETILQSLKTKFACSKRGYNFLRDTGFPLPSIRILQRRLQGINFNPGSWNDVFTFLKEKVPTFTKCEKECVLVVDEMSIIEGKQYDIATQSYIGSLTIPLAKSLREEEASHALIFLIVGISSKYKQVVRYDLSGGSIHAATFLDIVITIVKKAWDTGLKCNALISDMGGSNTAVWKLCGIKATRKGTVVNSIPHPCDPKRRFYIIADVPHLMKNLVQSLRNNRTIVFDKCIVDKYNLTSNTVQCSDINDLFNLQKDDLLKLAPKLKDHMFRPNNFQRMNVPVSTNLIGSNVSTGLYYMFSELRSSEQQHSTYETTAWFCQVMTTWFKLMTARHYTLGLTEANFEETSDTLNEVIDIIKHAKFGEKGKWKPFQRGLIVSVTSVLELSKYLLSEQRFEFVLLGRFLQDCAENMFSVVRSGNPKCNALQVRDAIKSIAISEYLSPPLRNVSYDWDDSKFLSNFLAIVQSISKDSYSGIQLAEAIDVVESISLDISKVKINRREQNVLYKIACYILYRITVSKKKVHCDHCLSACSSPYVDKYKKYTQLSRQPNLQYLSHKHVLFVNQDIFKYFLKIEKNFRLLHPILCENKIINLNKIITNKILDLGVHADIPNCHSLSKTLLLNFVNFRLKNGGKGRKKTSTVDFSSKTIN